MTSNRLIFILTAVAVILLIPFVAMQFTSEVNWTGLDFVAMGILLLSLGLLIDLVVRKVSKSANRIAICAVIVVVFLLVWMELAVGLFGTPFAGS